MRECVCDEEYRERGREGQRERESKRNEQARVLYKNYNGISSLLVYHRHYYDYFLYYCHIAGWSMVFAYDDSLSFAQWNGLTRSISNTMTSTHTHTHIANEKSSRNLINNCNVDNSFSLAHIFSIFRYLRSH